ncbi:MAG: hypothetical protein QG646_1562 [Euryarchaeota archaeon]|nr:hypothetical protein [Euryarchaeota archaeon]
MNNSEDCQIDIVGNQDGLNSSIILSEIKKVAKELFEKTHMKFFE